MPRKPADPAGKPLPARARAATDRPVPLRQPETPMRTDKELHETLDLLSQVVADISDRVDGQTAALGRLADAQAHTDPERVAAATSNAVRETFLPDMTRLVDVVEDLTGRKEVLRKRIRALTAEEARLSRWRRHVPLAWALAAALALVVVFALVLPRALAQTGPTCWAMGGHWRGDDATPKACVFWLEE